MTPDFDARAFSDLAAALHAAPTPGRTAEEVVDYARDQLDADYAGITLIRSGGRLQTVAPSEERVQEVDKLQYDLDEGPCRDSSWRGRTMVSQDLSIDERWPRWGPKVVDLGVSSALAVELLSSEGRRLGSVNLYWNQARMFGPDDVAFASVFARHAALALAVSMEVAGLHTALDGRKRIGQAQGILMERYHLDEDQAFEVLRRYSQDHNIKLRALSEQLVASRRLPDSDPAVHPGG